MTKILINRCYGGFRLSKIAVLKIRELGGHWCITPPVQGETGPEGTLEGYDSVCYRGDRANPLLISAVEAVGIEEASGGTALLKIVEIPDGVSWEIESYDGLERVAETHRTWR